MDQSKKHIVLYKHPDELFDRPYKQHKLDIDEYNPVQDCKVTCMNIENGIALLSKDGRVLYIQFSDEYTIRIQAFPTKNHIKERKELTELYLNSEDVNYSYHETDHYIYVQNSLLKVKFDKFSKNISVWDKNDEVLLESLYGGVLFSDTLPDYSGYKTLMHYKINEESFFGFGGRVLHPNRTGTTVDVFNIKAGVVSGDYGGCAVPFFLSTKGYGFFLNNPWPHVYFDMGKTREDEWFFNTPGGCCDFFIFYGPQFKNIIKRYTKLTGRMPVPPKWFFGFWFSSLTIKNADELIDVAQKFRKDNLPLDVILIDAPWRVGPEFLEQYTTDIEYKSNDINWKSSFGNKDNLIDTLKKSNIKLGLHLNSRNFSKETEEYGLKNKYLIKAGNETIINFQEKEAVSFYQNKIEERIKEGVDIWWIDHSDRVSGEIGQGIPCRNLLGTLWSKVISDTMKKNDCKNILSITRGAGIGGQKYGFPWPGDTANGIEHFEEDLWFCMNAGMGGFPVSSVDLGGFNLKRLVYGLKKSEYYQNDDDIYNEVFDDDNILRRVCHGIFCIPVPRIHNNWCTPSKTPWNCEEKVRKVYKAFLEERYKLVPYIYSAAIYASRTGEPILKPLVYEYREDRNVYDIGDECLFGESLLIAPVTEKDVVSRKIYLPKGIWINMWNDDIYYGPCTIDVEAPLYSVSGLPIFIKNDSIIPRQLMQQYLEDDPPSTLILDYYLSHQATLALNESEKLVSYFMGQVNNREYNLYLENNTLSLRRYIIKLHSSNRVTLTKFSNCIIKDLYYQDKVFVIDIEVEPNRKVDLICTIYY